MPICLHEFYAGDSTTQSFFAVDFHGVLESQDGGQTWKNAAQGFPWIFGITNPRLHPYYVGTGSGVYGELLDQDFIIREP